MIYLELFLNFAYIGALAFGGGYAALPLIQQQCVDVNGWLTMAEFSDVLTISQITPGPISINAATFAGMQVTGFFGGLVATLGFLIPPFIMVSLIYLLYKKYGKLHVMQDILSVLKPAVIGLITVAAVNILIEALWGTEAITLAGTDLFAAVLSLCAFFVLRKWKLSIILTILSCGVIGILWELVFQLF